MLLLLGIAVFGCRLAATPLGFNKMKYIFIILMLITFNSCSNWQVTAVKSVDYKNNMSTNEFIQELRAQYLSKSSYDATDFMKRDTLNDGLVLTKIDLGDFFISFIDYKTYLLSVYYWDKDNDNDELTYFNNFVFRKYNSNRPSYLRINGQIDFHDNYYYELLGVTCENRYGDVCEIESVGIIPDQRIAFFELVKNGRTKLLAKALKGFSPAGRLYAAEGLLLLKERGYDINKKYLAIIDSLKSNDKEKFWKCFNGIGSYKGEYSNFGRELTIDRIKKLKNVYKFIQELKDSYMQ